VRGSVAVRIIAHKFPDFNEDFDALLVALAERSRIVMIGSMPVDICRDPNDNFIIETALIGHAEFVVTGDNDLLSLLRYETVAFVTARQWLDRFAK